MPTNRVSFALPLAAFLLSACVKTKVAPLGSTRDGRRQFQVTCNQRATDNGACDEAARESCGGDYETLSVGNTGAEAITIGNQVSSVPGRSVWLIACNAES